MWHILRKKIIGLWLVAGLLAGIQAAAVTRYINNDANACPGCSDSCTTTTAQTASTGCDTINKCISFMAAGDVCEIGGANAVYPEVLRTATGDATDFTVSLIPSGAWNGSVCTSRTTIKAQAGLSATPPQLKPAIVFTGQLGIFYANTTTGEARCIDIGAVGQGLFFDATVCSNNPNIAGCMPFVLGKAGGTSHDIRIIGNTLVQGATAQGGGAVLIHNGAHGNTVSNNTIRDYGRGRLDHGIYIKTQDNIVTYNDIFNSAGSSFQIYATASDAAHPTPNNNIACWNKFHANGRFDPGNPSFNVTLGGDGNLICGNLIYDSIKHAVSLNSTSTATGNKVYNNSISGASTSSGPSFGIIVAAGATNMDIRNNILRDTDGYSDSGTGTIFTNNMGCPTCNSTADPLFVSPPANLHLNTGSPAIDFGTNLTGTVPTDFDGVAYSVPMEPGAYNFAATLPPSRLEFVSPPQGATTGATLPPVVAQVTDAAGVVQPSHANNCVIAKQSGPGTLSGTLSVAPASGICTWSTLSLDTAGTYSLVATSPGTPTIAQVISGSFAITDTGILPQSKFLIVR